MRVVRAELGDRMLKKGMLAHDGQDILMNLAASGDPGARVEDILAMFKAGEKLSTVAGEMGVSTNDVESTVRTHLGLAA
jgi:hypothetical protein